MTADFASRVRRGIARLEEYEPGSTDRIDLGTLDLYDWNRCAIAQSIGDGNYLRGHGLLGLPYGDSATAKYGFSTTHQELNALQENYEALRQAWITELTAHRTAKAAIVAD